MPTPTSAFGRTRSGRSPWPASLLIGGAVSASLALIATLVNPGSHPWLLAALLLTFTLPVAVMGGWALVVDRSTVRGATARPDESVEHAWLDRAAVGAFFDTIAVAGLATAALSLAPGAASIPAAWPLGALTLVAMGDFGVRYLMLTRGAA